MDRHSVLLLASLACCVSPVGARDTQTDRAAALDSIRDHVVIWLEADSLNLPAGGPVAEWRGPPGAALSAVQPIEARRPTFQPNSKGDLPAVRFVASDRQTLIIPNVRLAADSTQFFVFSPTGFGRDAPFFEHGSDVNTQPGSFLYGDRPMFAMHRGGMGRSVLGQSAWVYLGSGYGDLELALGLGRVWIVVTAVYSSGDSQDAIRIRRNGIRQNDPVPDAGGVAGALTATFHIGSRNQIGYWSNMELGELILVNRSMTDVEVRLIERYLARKWGIGLDE